MSNDGDGESVVSARGLGAAYGATAVWADADFDVGPGEFVAVLGPNGAGKSTMLRVLLGLLRPAAGTVAVLGDPPRRGNPAIGYVPQRRPVDSDVRVAGAEFVKLGVVGHRWGTGLPGRRAGHAAIVADALAAVGAESYADQSAGTLSGGELQRLMLAQAMVSKPRLLLLDEPLASLDVRNQVAMAGLIASVAQSRRIAVMLIAHDINPLLPVVDRVMYVARGRVSVGRPADVITSEHLSSLYQANVEVLHDSRGRIFVVGLEDETAHPHDRERAHDPSDPC